MKAKNLDLAAVDRFMSMVAQSTITLVSNKSLYGCVYCLQLRDDASTEYLRWSHTDGFVDSTTIIVKCVALTPAELELKDRFAESIITVTPERRTMQWKQLEQEAAVQHHVWLKSVKNGKQQLCPAVAEVIRIDGDEAVALKSRLHEQTGVEPVGLSDHIGIIVMDIVDNASVLDSFRDNSPPLQVYTFCIYTVVMIISMYLETGVIHNDLHLKNVMIQGDHAIAIDFGRFRMIPDNDYNRARLVEEVRSLAQRRCAGNVIEFEDSNALISQLLLKLSWADTYFNKALRCGYEITDLITRIANQLFDRAQPQQCDLFSEQGLPNLPAIMPIQPKVQTVRLSVARPPLSSVRASVHDAELPLALPRASGPLPGSLSCWWRDIFGWAQLGSSCHPSEKIEYTLEYGDRPHRSYHFVPTIEEVGDRSVFRVINCSYCCELRDGATVLGYTITPDHRIVVVRSTWLFGYFVNPQGRIGYFVPYI